MRSALWRAKSLAMRMQGAGRVALHAPARKLWSLGGARGLAYFRVGVDEPGPGLPVFEGKRVLDGSIEVRLDKILDEYGVCVLGE